MTALFKCPCGEPATHFGPMGNSCQACVAVAQAMPKTTLPACAPPTPRALGSTLLGDIAKFEERQRQKAAQTLGIPPEHLSLPADIRYEPEVSTIPTALKEILRDLEGKAPPVDPDRNFFSINRVPELFLTEEDKAEDRRRFLSSLVAVRGIGL